LFGSKADHIGAPKRTPPVVMDVYLCHRQTGYLNITQIKKKTRLK